MGNEFNFQIQNSNPIHDKNRKCEGIRPWLAENDTCPICIAMETMGTCAREAAKRRSGTIFNGMLGTVLYSSTSQQCEMQATHMTVERATLVKTAGCALHSLCTVATDWHVTYHQTQLNELYILHLQTP